MEHLNRTDRLDPQSLKKLEGQQVDLVVYKGNERIVISRAEIKPNGAIEAQIAKDIRKDVMAIIGGKVGNVSINPKR